MVVEFLSLDKKKVEKSERGRLRIKSLVLCGSHQLPQGRGGGGALSCTRGSSKGRNSQFVCLTDLPSENLGSGD